MNLMLRSKIFPCSPTRSFRWNWRYALCSSLSVPPKLVATLHDLHSQLYINWCYALYPHFHAYEFDATLYDLHWRFYINWLLRPLIFSCQSSWTCAPWSAFAVLNELDAMAMVSDLHLQFYMNVLLRSIIVTCSSTWVCCSAAWSSLAALHELDATLLVFPCNSTWTTRNALWSSLACLHELDAALCGLHLQFFMNLGLTLRSRIFACFSMILACIPTRLDATRCDLHLHFFMNLTLRSMIFT